VGRIPKDKVRKHAQLQRSLTQVKNSIDTVQGQIDVLENVKRRYVNNRNLIQEKIDALNKEE